MTHSKMTHSIMKWTVAAALAPALVTAALLAQTSPHYVNARKFLKTAQVLIRIPPQPNVQLTLKPADDAVQAAIGELDRGAHTGPQDCAEQLGAGASQMKEGDRLRSIVDLLHSARNEINQETSNADWRASALKHINAALDAVHRAAVNAHLDREIGSF